MTSLAELSNGILLSFLASKTSLQRLKIRVGLATEVYGMCNPFKYKGIWWSPALRNAAQLEASENYDNFKSDDIIIAAYPKTGTHFIMEILGSIHVIKGMKATHSSSVSVNPPLETVTPFAGNDESSLTRIDEMISPRVISTHLHWNSLPAQIKDGKVKVIHCIRNPKDVLCSMFPFYKKIGEILPTVQWNDFIEWFMEGNVTGGGYFQYLREWYPNRNQQHILNVEYEDMKKDLRGNVIRISEFLNIELTDQQIDSVVTANTFENKKKEVGRNHPMFRRGKSGGWKTDLSVQQNERLDEWIEAELKGMDELEFHYL